MSKNNQVLEVVSIDQIDVSKTNPRKSFDEKALNELTQSIKEHGILQPVLVRPVNSSLHEPWEQFELVCGERRYRAAKLAGLEEIPVNVRVLTDDEAFELQIIENLERKDVHPLDEADAFKKMLDSGKYTIADIAAKMAKPESFIVQRLKLVDLIDELKEDFLNEKFGIGHAILLAKIGEEQQKEIFNDANDKHNTGYGTVKDLRNEIENSNNNLDEAIFDLEDATIYPKAGACNTCAKCSKANPVLFPDEKEENLCFDNFCFREKEETFFYNKIEEVIKNYPGIIFIGNYYDRKEKIIESLLKENNKIILKSYSEFEEVEDGGVLAYHIGKMQTTTILLKEGAKDKNISSDPNENIKSEIKKIKEKADRALELDREKIYTRIIDEIVKGENKLLNNDPLTGDEITAFVYALWEKGSYEFRKWFKEEYKIESSLDSLQMLDFIDEQIDTEGTYKIFRAYIIHNLVVGYSLDYKKSGNAAAVYSMVKLHHGKQVELFEIEQQGIANNRIAKTNAKIKDLEYSITASDIGPDVGATAKQFGLENEYHNTEDNKILTTNKNIKGDPSNLAKLLNKDAEEEIGEGSSVITSTLNIPTFHKIVTKKRYALNNSYFKNRLPSMPDTPLEVMYYFNQHGELPFDMGSDTENWLYECYVEYQKRAGVYGSQFFTPPATAKRMAELAEEYFQEDCFVLDACCGFGMLSKAVNEKGFIVIGFDVQLEILELYNHFTGCISENISFNGAEVLGKYENVISNPPYEIPVLTEFLESLHNSILEDFGVAILLLPKGFIDKDKPKALVSILEKFNVVHREDMDEEFARTKVNAEIVVIEKL